MQSNHKKIIFIAVLLAGCAVTSFMSSKDKDASLPVAPVQSASTQRTAKKAQSETIRVQVTGAVLEPGIYELPAGSRAEAAIAAAGGLTADADTERVNMVRKLRDGVLLRVPAFKPAKTSAVKQKSTAKGQRQAGQQSAKRASKRKSGDGKN